MSSVGSFTDFIQSRDAAGLHVYMTNERQLPSDHIERNNRALFVACRDGAEEICEVLIRFGANVNSAVDQQTHLYIACLNAHPVCVDLLLSHGVNVNAGDLNYGRTPLMATASRNSPVCLTLDQFIDNRGQCMRSLLTAGAAIDQTDKDQWNALMYATWNFRLTEILVEAGANVNILNITQDSVLHIACGTIIVDVVELLLARGADIDAVNVNGWTPLFCACYFLYPVIVDLLLRYNANIDIVTKSGQTTALQLAISRPTSPIRVAVLQLMASCAQTRLKASSADWIRLTRNERRTQHLKYDELIRHFVL